MGSQSLKWIYLIVLSFIWGSSFILMKKALLGLTAIQIGALRILFAGILLILVGYKSIKEIKKHHWKPIFACALVGTFFPAFLFAYAIKGIDSSIASILNSITPFNALWIGVTVFGFTFNKKQLFGVFIGFVGTLLLILKSIDVSSNQNYWYALLPVIASIGYGFNVNIIKKHLQTVSPLAITTGSFVLIIFPAVIVLLFSVFFTSIELTQTTKTAFIYMLILAIIGTGVAKVMYNKLIQISTPVFSTSVAYIIPVIAVMWGVLDGEKLNILQLIAGVIILLGVYLVNKSK